MSFTISLEVDPAALTYEDLWDDGVACEEVDVGRLVATGPIQPGVYHHLYVPGVSTRSVEVLLEDRELSARIMTGSCTETHELALALIDRAAAIAGQGPARGEDGDGPFDRAWIAGQVESLASLLVTMAEREAGPLTISGPRRPCYLGKRVAAEVRAVGGSPGAALIARMRRVQYVDLRENYFAASTMQLRGKDDAWSLRFAIWAPGVRYLMPQVEAFSVHAPGGPLFVPAAVLPELAGARARPLDERQWLVDAIPEPEWDAVVTRAQAHAVEPQAIAAPT
jgi:hypothetical protein